MAVFRFKQFQIDDQVCGMKICTDSVLLGAWANIEGAKRILDLGSGSGVLALMCAQRSPSALVTAIEIDTQAASAAQANFEASPWRNRLTAICADAGGYSPEQEPDLIICNPPYFSTGLLSTDRQRAQARHAQSLSPLSAVDFAALRLSPSGSLAMVTPAECRREVTEHAEMARLKIRRICAISTSARKTPTRLLWQISRLDGPIESTNLSIRDSQGDLTVQYTSLTSDFYL